MTRYQDFRAAVAEVLTRAERDPGFRAALVADPGPMLADAGVPLPAATDVTVVADTDTVTHLAIPGVAELTAETRAAFTAEILARLPLAPGTELRLLQNTDTRYFLVVPRSPDFGSSGDDLADDELGSVVGGGGNGGNGGAGGEFTPPTLPWIG